MSVKKWILLIINSLVILVVIILSLIFYFEFSKVLDKRILFHLNSIKTLKKIQVEDLIQKEWNTFKYSNDRFIDSSEIKLPKDKYLHAGIYDLTHLHPTKKTSISLIRIRNNQRELKVIPYPKIKQILLERTGMGASGESYIVGNDYRLRSQSRFFPETTPYKIKAKTIGVLDALNQKEGEGLFFDYRKVDVYSAYSSLKIDYLHWVILSEIDVNEVTIPLKEMRHKLFLFTLIIISLSSILSLFLTKIITNPIKKIQESLLTMAKGNYNQKLILKKSPTEIMEMFHALENLRIAIDGAVNFSVDIGKLNLSTSYTPKSKNDLLGKSLIKMRGKLEAYRTAENKINLTNKRLLVGNLENERRRLARELHDGVGPLLTTIKLYVQNKIDSGEHKESLKEMIDTTINEIRQMTNVLMPTSLDKFGIGATLHSYVENIQKSIKASIRFEDLTKEEASLISKEQEINIFRIVQELINNSIKHSKATKIRISLTEFDNFLSLYYFDNGTGFDLKKVNLGSGIKNIKERVEIFDGTLQIESAKKTIIEIEMPIKL
ncbi:MULTISPECIES: sensor histidine kinase [unclassified Polaribacter]|uniref:sensor histidine kinase n=1 Tax=unclassified Polaribacter TaxID=196858 RepID=UPI0011BF29F9|nr:MULTISPECIES: ATP-binding protein [unclassified Polaribacter]TXD53963.1 sensor histidine kinase [Polaribacter sp. IC063]TXD59672.1 sensor histidine kinase [Polaribacter sp. IC066]